MVNRDNVVIFVVNGSWILLLVAQRQHNTIS